MTKACGCIGQIRGGMGNVDATANGNSKRLRLQHFGKQTAKLGTTHQHIVRPFEKQVRLGQEPPYSVMHSKGGDETNLGGGNGWCF